jgi:MFS family permease
MLLLIGHVPLRATARADEDSDEHDETDDKTSSFLRELGEGWHEVVTRRWLWSVILSATLFLLLYEAPMQVVGPLTMKDHYNGAGTWGVVLAALAAGGTLGAIVSSTGRLRRPMLVSLWLFLATVLMPILLIVQAPTAALIACNLVVGFAFGLFDVAWASSLQHRVPEERMARVSAWDWMGSLAGMPLGFALAGGLIDLVGRDVVLVGMSLSTLVVCVALLASREIRSLGDELVPNRSSE